jgi:aspartyl-tRNA synthetase
MAGDCTRMPSAGRIKIGIDWLTVLLTAAESMRDVILFVLLDQRNSAAVRPIAFSEPNLKAER